MRASPTARPVTVALVSDFVTEATVGLLDANVTALNFGIRVPFASLAWTYTVTDCPTPMDVPDAVSAMDAATAGPAPPSCLHAVTASATRSKSAGRCAPHRDTA